MSKRRVIVHAGFHKTGTTSAQRYLHANGKHIWPRCALVLPRKVNKGAALTATRNSRLGTAGLLTQFEDDLHKTLSAINLGKRNVLISEERFAGGMPGRDGQMGYGAAPALLASTEKVIHDVFGPGVDLVFHLSTRDPKTWLRSTYKHNVRVSRLTESWDNYRAIYASAADLVGVVRAVDDAVRSEVQTHDLADMTGVEGTAGPLIDLIALPDHRRRKLTPQPRQNVGPDDEMTQQMLDLNKSTLSNADLRASKSKLMKAHHV